VVVLAAVVGAGAVVVATSTPASAYPSSTVSFEGHGYGHGHGMGQWGALGDALAQTGYHTILDTYYGGTSLTALTPSQDATQISVALTENNGNTVIVTSASPFTVGNVSAPAGSAVQLAPDGNGRWTLYQGPGCAGPWGSPLSSGLTGPTAVPSGPALLQLCQAGGRLTVHGTIKGTYNTGSPATPRTVNTLPLEQYVADVVPGESSAGWGELGGSGPQGQAWGFQELEAQAVAVRSYAMAGLGSYGGYADTCDLDCQTYRGTLYENALTNLAASDTSAQVMESNGVVAATQYSASTGGYTNPGAFPAVPDNGDAVCVPGACNPNHTWTASVPVSAIEAAWPQLGTLQSISITGRNGDGDWGGRVTAMTLNGSRQDVSMSGDAFAAAVGLKSDWFTTTTGPGSAAVGMAANLAGGGYWITAANGAVTGFGGATSYGSAQGLALVRPIVGMAATPDDKGYWLAASDGGIFSFGDAHFYGSTGSLRLNKPVVGMAATPDGRGYWLVASDGGIFSFGDAHFYGSTGSLRLNKPVVGMAATPDGRGYWLVASDGGIFSFGDAKFYGSTGSLRLNKPVVGMAATPDDKGYWLAASDGGIFSFGTARFHGSTGSLALVKPVVGVASTGDAQGYWLVAADGGLFTFGDAGFDGSAAG
jgi:SpoIID/LytB domain protein